MLFNIQNSQEKLVDICSGDCLCLLTENIYLSSKKNKTYRLL